MEELYCVWDRTAERAGPLFQAVNDGIALRKYEAMLDREGLRQYEDELQLLSVGRFDPESAEITAYPGPKEVVVSLKHVGDIDDEQGV